MFVQHQADTYYILLVEVVHSRIFDEALLASIATKVAQAFEDALEAIKQVCVCVCVGCGASAHFHQFITQTVLSCVANLWKNKSFRKDEKAM